jgi:eukaryotic-like serine/threonine-protein kinase
MAGIDEASWRVVSPLLDELLDADAEQRAARLSQLHTQDPELAGQLEALLSQQAVIEREHFLEGAASAGIDAATLVGRTIGDYTIERPIGQGGMGSVWLARRSDGRYEGYAAVKFLNLALLGVGGAKRFRREGNALAKLSHPNITHLIDAGIENGQPYLVLEYVEGQPIDRWCDAQALDVTARIQLFLQVLAAVSHAHGRLILHRDLKPSNILVTTEGRAKLLDFGIAKLLTDEVGTDPLTELTRQSGQGFTPDYAAPEQLQQRSEATTATDVYALGVLLYVLLTGTHPTVNPADTPVVRLRSLVEREPARMSEVALNASPAAVEARASSLSHLARTLRGDLDNIVAKALKKSPDERYATADAFAADLRRYLRHEPVSARPDSLRYRAGKFVVRNKLVITSVASVVIGLAVSAAIAVSQAIEANQRRAEAELEARQARASHDLLYLLYSDPAVSPDAATMLGRLAKVRAVIRQNDDPELKVALLLQLGGRYLELSALDELLDLLKEVRGLTPPDGNPRHLATIACGFGNAYVNLGRLDDAGPELAAGAEHLRRIESGDLDARAECLSAESQLAVYRGEFERAVALAEQGVELFETHGRTTDTRYTNALNQLSIGYAAVGDFPRAYASIRKARDVLDHLGLGHTQKDLIDALQEIQLLNLGGKPVAALELIENLLASPQVSKYSEVPRFVIDQHQGTALLRLARYPAAIEAFEAAFAGASAAGHQSFILLSRLSLIDASAQGGRFDEAQARLTATADVQDEIDKASPPGVIYLLAKARIAFSQGAVGQADQLAQQALLAVRQRNRPNDTQLRGVAALAARLALARQDWSRAATLADAVLDVARATAIDRQSSAFIGEALLLKAESRKGAGEAAGAADLARQALVHLQQNLGATHPLTRAAVQLAGGER